MNLLEKFKNTISENVNYHLKLPDEFKKIEKSIDLVTKSIKKRGKILFCGNGNGTCGKFCDVKLIVTSKIKDRIQECHIA